MMGLSVEAAAIVKIVKIFCFIKISEEGGLCGDVKFF
jgi:hypothetical protein